MNMITLSGLPRWLLLPQLLQSLRISLMVLSLLPLRHLLSIQTTCTLLHHMRMRLCLTSRSTLPPVPTPSLRKHPPHAIILPRPSLPLSRNVAINRRLSQRSCATSRDVARPLERNLISRLTDECIREMNRSPAASHCVASVLNGNQV